MAQLFSGKGDDGSTGLLGEERVSKADLLIEVIGSLDEVNAFLGNAKSLLSDKPLQELLEEIQRDLYHLMAELANTHEARLKVPVLDESRVSFLEQNLAEISQQTTMPAGFILPGETREAAAFGLCRVIARRAERRMVELNGQQPLKNPAILRYLNRLSSLLFLLEVVFSRKGKLKKFKYAREL